MVEGAVFETRHRAVPSLDRRTITPSNKERPSRVIPTFSVMVQFLVFAGSACG